MTRQSLDQIVGKKFGRLTVVGVEPGTRDTTVICVCECGNQKVSTYSNVKSGNTKSCGCWLREYGKIRGSANTTHGESSSREYRTWISMKRRCSLETHKDFKYWGARGIRVCNRWIYSFENFLADMGRAPDGMSIDRIDTNGNYTPSNCRWATDSDQSKNRRKYSQEKLRKISRHDVTAIRSDKAIGKSWAEISRKYDVGISAARKIVARKTYQDVP